MQYQCIDESVYINFGKKLSQKGKNKTIDNNQLEFLQACRDGKNQFLKYLDDNLLNKKDTFIEGNTIFLKHKFTENEFKQPPKDTQQAIWDNFNIVPKQYVGDLGFWGNVVINMIRDDYVKPEYFAFKNNSKGIVELDFALNSDDGNIIDTCARRVLRSMACSPVNRGRRIIFDDFSLSRSYWRFHWANMLENDKNLGLMSSEILDIFDETNYSIFAQKMHSQKSYISYTNVLAGLVLFLRDNNSKLKSDNCLKKVIDNMSYISVHKAIGFQSPQQNYLDMKAVFENIS